MICWRCKKEMPKGLRYCGNCGVRLNRAMHFVEWTFSRKGLPVLLTVLALIIGLTVFFLLPKDAPELPPIPDVGKIFHYRTPEDSIRKVQEGVYVAENEILLVAEPGYGYEEIEKLAEAYGAQIVGWIELTGDYQLLLKGNYTEEELTKIAEEMEADERIQSAYPNYFFDMEENTEEHAGFIYGDEWEADLQNYGDHQGRSWGFEAIHTLEAWDVLLDNPENAMPVRLGLIDSGFDVNHEDLGFAVDEEGRIQVFYNDVDAGEHGTHVAGTMAARANNSAGICGVYPYGDGNLFGVSIEGIREDSRIKGSCMDLKVACAELILRDVKVINYSYGYYFDEMGVDYNSAEWLEWEGRIAYQAEIIGDFLDRQLKEGYDFVIVNSAGNASARSQGIVYDSKYNTSFSAVDRELYPEVYDRIIVVGSLRKDLTISDFSNGGRDENGNIVNHGRLDVYAPGEAIFSAVPGNGYESWNGTSMAAPHVSGVAALVWTLNQDLTGAQVKAAICNSENALCTVCRMVDAEQAMNIALGLEIIPDPTETEPEPTESEPTETEPEVPVNPPVAEGPLLVQMTVQWNPKDIRTFTFYYNEKGQITSMEENTSDGERAVSTFTYNEWGALTYADREEAGKGYLVDDDEYYYDGEKLHCCICSTSFSDGDKPYERWVYNRDAEGYPGTALYYNGYDDSGMMKEDAAYTYSYVLDDQGRIVELQRHDAWLDDGQEHFVWVYLFRYDEQGRLVEEVSFKMPERDCDPNGNPMPAEVHGHITYDYSSPLLVKRHADYGPNSTELKDSILLLDAAGNIVWQYPVGDVRSVDADGYLTYAAHSLLPDFTVEFLYSEP